MVNAASRPPMVFFIGACSDRRTCELLPGCSEYCGSHRPLRPVLTEPPWSSVVKQQSALL